MKAQRNPLLELLAFVAFILAVDFGVKTSSPNPQDPFEVLGVIEHAIRQEARLSYAQPSKRLVSLKDMHKRITLAIAKQANSAKKAA